METVLEIFDRNNITEKNVIYPLLSPSVYDSNKLISQIKSIHIISHTVSYTLPTDDDDIIIDAATSKKFKKIMRSYVINSVLANKQKILENILKNNYTEDELISAVINFYLDYFEDTGIFEKYIQDLLFNNESIINYSHIKYLLTHHK